MSIESFKPLNVTNGIENFNPDRRIEEKKQSFEKNNKFNPDKVMEKFYHSYEERIAQTPSNLERWSDNRGESICLPTNQEAKVELAKYGLKGIEYKNGNPDKDFEKCAKAKVEIDMTSQRYGKGGNFEKAYTECAKQWNKENKEGRNNWTHRDIEKYKKENNLTWHECVDKKHCYLISQVIHNDFCHIGGVAECKRRDEILNNEKGVTFDE